MLIEDLTTIDIEIYHFMKPLKYLVLYIVVLFSWGTANAATEENARLLFLAAEKALDQGQMDTYTFIKKELKDYPLIPYLEYQKSKIAIRHMSSHPNKGYPYDELIKVQPILQDLPLWEFLLYRWLKAEAQHQRWGNFVKGYQHRSKPFYSTEMQCYTHYAHYKHTGNKEHLNEALSLWLTGHSQPDSCDPLFTAMRQKKVIQPVHVAQRFFLSVEAQQYGLSQYLIKLVPKAEQATFQTWLTVAKKPSLLKSEKNQALFNQSQYKNKIYESLFYRYSREDVLASRDLFSELKVDLSRSAKAEITQDIAIRLSHKKDPSALSWLAKIPKAYLNPVASEWLIRLHLKDKNWAKVIETLESLDPLITSKISWQYWKARAHLALNQSNQGLKILNELSEVRNYYGFLASEHLKKPHPLKHMPVQINQTKLSAIVNHPAVKRIEELKLLRRNLSAKREWLHFIQTLLGEDKPIAAHHAFANGWYDLAIITMAQSDDINDLTIRFPLGYRDTVAKYAKENGLDQAWIFALTRQESAFSARVRSPVGATGLMQLMPSTATYVAKKYQLPKPSVYQLMDPNVNIAIGTKYLGALQTSFKGQMVLATASYNAGINRIISWLPETPLDSDIWIENMPYQETRHYVKNILTYMGIYKSMMGESFRLSSVMKPVAKFEEKVKTP